MFQTKVQDKSPQKDLNEIEISHVLDKEIKAMVIKMLTNLRRRMDDHRDNLNKEIYRKAAHKSFN